MYVEDNFCEKDGIKIVQFLALTDSMLEIEECYSLCRDEKRFSIFEEFNNFDGIFHFGIFHLLQISQYFG